MVKGWEIMDFSKDMQEILEDYTEEVVDVINESIDEVSKKARENLRTAGDFKNRRTKGYRQGWSVKKMPTNRATQVEARVVHNRTDYRLTHLLEFGHLTRSGGRTRAFPHIEPVEQESIERFVKAVERKLK